MKVDLRPWRHLCPTPQPTLRGALRFAAHTIFWSYNGLFVALVVFGLVPLELAAFADDVERGQVPIGLAALVIAAALVPVLSVLFAALRLRPGVRDRRRFDVRGLMALFFGVEAPLLIGLLFFCLGGLHPTPPLLFLIAAYLAGAAGQLFVLGGPDGVRPGWLWLQVALLSGGVMVGLYLAGLLSFFAAPVAAFAYEGLADAQLWRQLWRLAIGLEPVRLMGLLLFLWSSVLLLGVPAGLVLGPIWQLRRPVRSLARSEGRLRPLAAVVLCLVATGLGLALTWKQPQAAAFAATEAAPKDDAQRRAWLARAELVAAGLENAYLQDGRYLERASRSHLVEHAYRDLVDDRETRARLQDAFDDYAAPLVFDDVGLDASPEKARARYRAFLDRPIERAVRDELRAGLARRFFWNTGARRWDEDAERVARIAQQITVTEADGYANVELHDVYRSDVDEETELWVTFALPETAALTGLWMGPSPRRSEAFPFSVAPRGAARRVYEAQVRRRVDPALLEQVGPGQYRLRIFPVPGRRGDDVAPAVHVWLTYQALPTRGALPTPRVLDKRNVYFPDDALRAVNGARADHDGWAPERLETTLEARILSGPRFDGEHAVELWPLDGPRPPLSRHLRLGVVVDRSLSMQDMQDELHDALDALTAALPDPSSVPVLLTSGPARGEAPRVVPLDALRREDTLPFGGQRGDALFAQAAEHLPGRSVYVVLTDGGDLALDLPAGDARPSAPTYVWSLRAPAYGFDEATMRSLFVSSGEVVSDLEALLDRLARRPSGREVLGVRDGWAVVRGRSVLPPKVDAPPALSAAWAMRALPAPNLPKPHGPPHDPPGLARARTVPAVPDAHALARRTPVVTPWSSMIVLVNDAQRAALAQASAADDAFEAGPDAEEPLPQPAAVPGISGAPEPTTWVLLALASGGTLIGRRRKQRPDPR